MSIHEPKLIVLAVNLITPWQNKDKFVVDIVTLWLQPFVETLIVPAKVYEP